MARKQIGPALYELMRGRRPEPAAAEPKPEPQAADWGWLSPGRTVRVPIGYLLLAAAAVLVALVASFTVGYSRGQGQAKAEFDQQWLTANQAALAVPPPEARPAPPRQTTPQVPPGPPAPAAADQDPQTPGWGPVLSDPRQPGKNYFVLIHTQRQSAMRLAQFCRDHGVESYVIRAKNLSLYKVVALPGYGRGERSAEFVGALERRIEEVARKWKLQVNPRDDLAHYPEKFDG